MNRLNTPERMIIVHQGALGDFLMTWPSLAGLRKTFPAVPMLWAGSSSRLPLLQPLAMKMAPAEVHNNLQSFFREDGGNAPIPAGDRIIWFCLRKKPFQIKQENIFFLYGLSPDTLNSPRSLYADQMAGLHISIDPDWMGSFQKAFPRLAGPTDRTILLFPGSGNPAKNWPPVQFFELAYRLQKNGWNPIMVLGPVEQERGLQPPATMTVASPATTEDLIGLLQRAAFVIGNDSGPMHLAGYMGVPGLSIFGPTSPKQWGPLGLDILTRNLACSPCTRTARIACPDPVCVREITLEQVMARIEPQLATLPQAPKNETGS